MRWLGPFLGALLGCAALAAPASAALTGFEAGFPDTPVVGRLAVLEIAAQDPGAAVTGVSVDFGDSEGGFAESACGVDDGAEKRKGSKPTFELDHAFESALPHTVTITVITGGCVGQPVRTTRTLLVTPLGPLALPPGTDPPPGPELPPLPVDLPGVGGVLGFAAAECADADLAPSASTLGRVRKATQCLVNAERAEGGLRPLKRNKRLERAARRHTADMIGRAYFAHQGPSGPNLAARLRKARYRFDIAGENLGGGYRVPATPREVVEAWMHSSGHRVNILNAKFTHSGIGVAVPFPAVKGQGAIYTQDFGRP